MARVTVLRGRVWCLGEDDMEGGFGTPDRRTFLAGVLGIAGLIVAGCGKLAVSDVAPNTNQPVSSSPHAGGTPQRSASRTSARPRPQRPSGGQTASVSTIIERATAPVPPSDRCLDVERQRPAAASGEASALILGLRPTSRLGGMRLQSSNDVEQKCTYCVSIHCRSRPSPRTKRNDGGGNEGGETAGNWQDSLCSIELGVPTPITSEAPGATAIEDCIVQQVSFLRVAVRSHGGDHRVKQIVEWQHHEEIRRRRAVQRFAALIGDRAVDRVPERGSVAWVEARHRRQGGSGIEIKQVAGSHCGLANGGQRVEHELQTRGRASQLVMIKLPDELPTTIEIR